METAPVNPDIDPTRTLSKKQFILWRFWAHCQTQRELQLMTGEPLGTVKATLGDIYGIFRVSDKGVAMHLSWKLGIFTSDNCNLPGKKMD